MMNPTLLAMEKSDIMDIGHYVQLSIEPSMLESPLQPPLIIPRLPLKNYDIISEPIRERCH